MFNFVTTTYLVVYYIIGNRQRDLQLSIIKHRAVNCDGIDPTNKVCNRKVPNYLESKKAGKCHKGNQLVC
jgi:hypothetical protein